MVRVSMFSSETRFNERLNEKLGKHRESLTKQERKILDGLDVPNNIRERAESVWLKEKNSEKIEKVGTFVAVFMHPILLSLLLVSHLFPKNFFLANLDWLALILIWIYAFIPSIMLMLSRAAGIVSAKSGVIYAKVNLTVLAKRSFFSVYSKVMFFALLYFLVCTGHIFTTSILVLLWIANFVVFLVLKDKLKKIVFLGRQVEKMES